MRIDVYFFPLFLFFIFIDRPASFVSSSKVNQNQNDNKKRRIPNTPKKIDLPKIHKASTLPKIHRKTPLSASETSLNKKHDDGKENGLTDTASCCDCFSQCSPIKRWSDTGSARMSDIYISGKDVDFSSPACLAHMNTVKHGSLLTIESEIEFRNSNKIKTDKKSNKGSKKSPLKQNNTMSPKIKESKGKVSTNNYDDFDLADDAVDACIEQSSPEIISLKNEEIIRVHKQPKDLIKSHIRVNGKEEFPNVEELNKNHSKLQKAKSIAQDMMNQSNGHHNVKNPSSSPSKTLPRPKGINRFFTYNRNKPNKVIDKTPINDTPPRVPNTETTSFIVDAERTSEFRNAIDFVLRLDETHFKTPPRKCITERLYSTLPKMKKSHFHPSILYSRETNRTPFKVPKRTTGDGTNIYYWCDVPKKQIKGLKIF